MICKHCGKEIEDTATFCCYCGKRVNGKITCPACGAQMPDDALFCSECGVLLEENKPTQHPVQGEVAAADAATAPESGEVVASTANWKKILEYICCGLVACAALFGFVFTFLIGCKPIIENTGTSSGVFYENAGQNIYYYFGNVYKDIKQMGETDTRLTSVYVVAVMGTVIAAASIICGVVFGSITVAAAVKRFGYKKENVNFNKPAILTYLSFAVCATAFLALNAASMNYSGSSSSTSAGISASVTFNDAILAGLVVGGLSLGIYCVCRLVVRIIDAVKNKNNFGNSIIGVILGVFAVAIVAVSAMPAISISNNTYTASLGYLEFLAVMIGTSNASAISLVQTCSACGIIGFAVQLVILILAAKALFSSIWFMETGKADKTLGLAITNVVFSGVNIAMAVVCGNAFANANSTSSNAVTCSYGAPIALAILSVLLLVVAIVFKVYNDKTAAKALMQNA